MINQGFHQLTNFTQFTNFQSHALARERGSNYP